MYGREPVGKQDHFYGKEMTEKPGGRSQELWDRGAKREQKLPGDQGPLRPHRLEFQNRRAGSLTGVRDVISFDENQAVFDTEMGLLTIKGKDLHMRRLTLEKGEVDMDGMVDSLVYSSNESLRRSGDSLFNRLFR